MNLLYSFKKGIETNMRTLERSPLKVFKHITNTTKILLAMMEFFSIPQGLALPSWFHLIDQV